MFIEKLIHQRSFIRILSGLSFLLVLVSAGLLDIFIPVQAQVAGSTVPTATASPLITPTESVHCGQCIVWPPSDARLDVADGRNADIDQIISDSLHNIPIVRSFGVPDNGSILAIAKTGPPYRLQYNWDYSCAGTHDRDLALKQSNFVLGYYPTFFDSSVIDSANQYRRFLSLFKQSNLTTLIGPYSSATTCLDGLTSPYAENYYPPNAVDCHRLAPPYSPSMNTRPWIPQNCPAVPVKWYVNVGDPQIRARFRDNLIQTVKTITPTPPFVFLDNIIYMEPEYAWSKGKDQKFVDCRTRASITAIMTKTVTASTIITEPACSDYHLGLLKQFGPNIYFDDFIEHYRMVITGLEQEGIRSILNTGEPPAVIGYSRDKDKFAKKFADVIGKNGINFEAPFAIAFRQNADDTVNEVELHRDLLNQGALVIFGDYTTEASTYWYAAMAMLIKNPGQSLFVMRDNISPTNWITWPLAYGTPIPTTTLPLPKHAEIGDSYQIGHDWTMQRQFLNLGVTREITVVHFGVNLETSPTFSLTLLVPALNQAEYHLQYEQVKGQQKLGRYENGVYTVNKKIADTPNPEADYFFLGAQCEREPCKKLIAVSVAVFKHKIR